MASNQSKMHQVIVISRARGLSQIYQHWARGRVNYFISRGKVAIVQDAKMSPAVLSPSWPWRRIAQLQLFPWHRRAASFKTNGGE